MRHEIIHLNFPQNFIKNWVNCRNVSSKVSTSFTEWFPEEAARRLDWAGNLKQILTKDRGVLKILDKKIGISDYIAKGKSVKLIFAFV